jgi:hypothetical protein
MYLVQTNNALSNYIKRFTETYLLNMVQYTVRADTLY